MISDKTIEQLQEAVSVKIIEDSAGNEYSTKPLERLPVILKPGPEALKISTLSGFVDYVANHSQDGADPEGNLIHIVSHKEVRLLSPLYGACQRSCFIVAQFEELLGKSFNFGAFYDHETFVIALQCLFVDTPEREKLFRLIATIKDSHVRESIDDGITQTVTAKAGSTLVKEVPVPNPVELKPWRTFREIDQPASKFVLRVRSKEGEKPECALFEADGGIWKLEAIAKIREYIVSKNIVARLVA